MFVLNLLSGVWLGICRILLSQEERTSYSVSLSSWTVSKTYLDAASEPGLSYLKSSPPASPGKLSLGVLIAA